MNTAEAVRCYYDRGWNPLPSRADVKGPALRDYARYRDGERIPESWLARWWTPNVQVCLGACWGLLAVDLDGPAAAFRWHTWTRRRGCPPTWTVRTGGGGVHLWFAVPPGVTRVETRKVWGIWDRDGGHWMPHTYIEILGDRSLLIAPPSRHVRTGLVYGFLPGLGPAEIARPAVCPDWIPTLPPIIEPSKHKSATYAAPSRQVRGCTFRCVHKYPHRGLLGRLAPELKLAVARNAGLRVTGRTPNSKGFLACRSIYREDRNPSASYHFPTGIYKEQGMPRLCYPDLLVELGWAWDRRAALDALEALA